MGVVLGDVVLEKKLGQGGMASVWRGRHRDTGAVVAVKLIPPQSRTVLSRALESEVRAAASLEHAHVVPLLDFHRVPEGCSLAPKGSPAIVMAMADQGTLLDVYQRGNVTGSFLKARLQELLSALGHAHARGVLHRDVKAANVLLHGPEQHAWLADFGVSWSLGRRSHRGRLVGTMVAMPPEQLERRWRDHGPSMDLYALGLMTWELVTGRPLFQQTTIDAAIEERRTAALPELMDRAALHEWLMHLLAWSPRDRYPSAAHAQKVLADIPDHELSFGAQRAEGVRHTLGASLWTEMSRAGDETWVDDDGGQSPPSAMPIPSSQGINWARLTVPQDWRGPPRVRSYGVGVGLFVHRRSRFFGREKERTQLWVDFAQVCAAERTRVAVIVGEEGIGRRRLGAWLKEQAHERVGAWTWTFRCAGNGPQEMLRALARHLLVDDLPVDAIIERLRRQPGGEHLKPLTLGFLGRMLSAPTEWQGGLRETAAVLSSLFLARASEGVGVLCFEDAHRSPLAMQLAQRLSDRAVPLMLVLTGHSALHTDLGGISGMRLVALEALDELSHRQLVTDLVRLEGAHMDQIAERTFGHPGFAVALVTSLVAAGQLLPGPLGCRLAVAGPLPLEERMASLWHSRINAALASRGDADWEATERLAVAGRSTQESEWQASCAPHTVDALADALIAAGLLRREHGRLTWLVNPVRMVLLQRAAQQGRMVTHHSAWAAVLATGMDDVRLGRHLVGAGRLEAGIPLLLAQADHLLRRGHLPVVWALLRDARSALDELDARPEDERRHLVMAQEARCLRMEGREPEAVAKAEAVVNANASKEAVGIAHLLLGGCAQRRQDIVASRMHTQLALAALSGTDSPHKLAAQFDWVGQLVREGRKDEARTHIQALLETPLNLERTRIMIGVSPESLHALDFGRREALLLRAIDTLRGAGELLSVAVALNDLGEAYRLEGRMAQALAAYCEGADILEALGRADAGILLLNVTLIHLHNSRWDAAEVNLKRALALLQSVGHQYGVLGARCLQVQLAIVRGGSPTWNALVKEIQSTQAAGFRLHRDMLDILHTALAGARAQSMTAEAEAVEAILAADAQRDTPASTPPVVSSNPAHITVDEHTVAFPFDTGDA